ncbi:MAG: hypothetical protein MI861_15700, partial [Pirellulales bacterium]|nr:hypothetical protein [Pirellulales bacterium]
MNPYQSPIEKQERGTDVPATSVFSQLGLFWLAVMFAISVGVSALTPWTIQLRAVARCRILPQSSLRAQRGVAATKDQEE